MSLSLQSGKWLRQERIGTNFRTGEDIQVSGLALETVLLEFPGKEKPQ